MSDPDRPPTIHFGAPMAPCPATLSALFGEALAAGWLTNGGALHQRLERALSDREERGDAASLVSSGTMALMLALGLGRLPAGAEVITTPLSFAATVQAIHWCGLQPVFADVEPETLTLCPAAAEAAITPRTAAIVSVHFLGVPGDVKALERVAARHGLWLVHDAAQAFGVTLDGRPLGRFGDATAYSLHATKVLHCCEGGFVVTRQNRAQDLRRLRNFGLDGGRPARPGLNGKMSELHAATGLALLPGLEAEIGTRLALRRQYDTALEGVAGLRRHGTRPGASPSPGQYVIRLAPADRARVHHALADAWIVARDHFPLLSGPGTLWEDAPIVTRDGRPPVAPSLAPGVLGLPLHGGMTGADVNRICGVIRATLEQGRAG